VYVRNPFVLLLGRNVIVLTTQLRLLTRAMPIIFEDPDSDFVHNVLWSNLMPPVATSVPQLDQDEAGGVAEQKRPPLSDAEAAEEAKVQAEVAVGTDSNAAESSYTAGQWQSMLQLMQDELSVPCDTPLSQAEAAAEAAGSPASDDQQAEAPPSGDGEHTGPAQQRFVELHALLADAPNEPLGRQMVHAVMRLAFAPGLTVQQNEWNLFQDQLEKSSKVTGATIANAVWPSLLWYGGIGFQLSPPNRGWLNQNRQELLRCIIALLAAELYVTPNPRAPARSLISDALVAGDAPFAPTLFYSLVNAAHNMQPQSLSMLPYSAALTSDQPYTTATACVQVLLLLLNYSPLVLAESTPTPAEQEHTSSTEAAAAADSNSRVVPIFNRYRVLLSSLTEPADFALLFRGIEVLLQNSHATKATWLPNTVRALAAEQEGAILLWKCLDENRAFMQWVLSSPEADICGVVRSLCFLLWTSRNNPARIGLVNIMVFAFLLLSGEREFAVALNSPYDGSLPADLPAFTGSHADLLVITLHKLVVNSDARVMTLFPCIFTTVNNITPYTRSLCMVSAVKLMSLLELAADPAVLASDPAAPGHLNKLLLGLNNIIQYQYSGNAHVVYAMVRRADIFNALSRVIDVPSLLAMTKASAPPPLAETVSKPTLDPMTQDEQAQLAAAAPSASNAAASPRRISEGGVRGVEQQRSFNTPPLQTASGSGREDGAVPAAAAGTPATRAVREPFPPAELPTGADTPTEERGTPVETVAVPAVPAGASMTPTAHAGDAGAEAGGPTEEYLALWLPETHAHLHAIQSLLGHLVPKVAALLEASDGTADEQMVLEFLQQSTMVGLLPVPHALVMHKYTANEFTQLWFTTFMWGVVFLRNQEFPIYDTRKIRLFAITVE